MHRIAVVDDEPKILAGIVEMLKEVVRDSVEVTGYQSAKHLLEKNERVDILITDICMPEMDGLELGHVMRERYERCKLIIISGYDDFDYARSAIRLRVCDYLLKPIDRKQLEYVVLSALKDLDEEQEKNLSDAEMKSFSELLGQMILGTNEKAKSLLSEHYVERFKDYKVYLMEYKSGKYKGEAWIWKKIKSYGVEFYFIKENRGIFLGNTERDNDFWKRLCEEADEFREKISVGISRKSNGIECLEKAFHQALEAAKREIYFEKSGIYEYDGLKWLDLDIEKLILTILNYLSNGDTSGFYMEFQKLFVKIKKEKPSIQNLRDVLLRIVGDLQYVLGQIDVRIIENRHIEDNISNLDQYHSIQEIEEVLYEYLEEVTTEVNQNKKNRMEQKLQSAIEYMEEHFRVDIPLNTVAEVAHLNPSYFSTCFKKYTGYSVVDYITKLRIDEAKHCLEDQELKISEIAEKIGFRDAKYFAKIFKKNVGVTPSEYRDVLFEIKKELSIHGKD